MRTPPLSNAALHATNEATMRHWPKLPFSLGALVKWMAEDYSRNYPGLKAYVLADLWHALD